MNARSIIPFRRTCDDSSMVWTVGPSEEYDVLRVPNSRYISYILGTRDEHSLA